MHTCIHTCTDRGSLLHLTGDSPEFKDALMQSGLGADTAVHGDEVCPAHCKGKCIFDGAVPNPFVICLEVMLVTWICLLII